MKPRELILDFDDAPKLRVVTANGDLTWVGTAPQIVRAMAAGDWEGASDAWTFMKNVQRRIENHFNLSIRIKKGNCTRFLRELERIRFIRVKVK
jgi:hypothetical protein